jgi:uncharacterized protein (DUF488 family)
VEPSPASPVSIWTIGHSTRTAEEFVALLRAHAIVQIADVRTVPKSRRSPHFSSEALAAQLPASDIGYRHFAALGGLRKPRPDSVNGGWQHESFRGYADYMETPAFQTGLDDLLLYARTGSTAVMCAEAVWWQCHRRLIADALTVRGIAVRHIMAITRAEPHALTPFARLSDGRVTYPGLLDLPEPR